LALSIYQDLAIAGSKVQSGAASVSLVSLIAGNESANEKFLTKRS
jgi:hypothetical protein